MNAEKVKILETHTGKNFEDIPTKVLDGLKLYHLKRVCDLFDIKVTDIEVTPSDLRLPSQYNPYLTIDTIKKYLNYYNLSIVNINGEYYINECCIYEIILKFGKEEYQEQIRHYLIEVAVWIERLYINIDGRYILDKEA